MGGEGEDADAGRSAGVAIVHDGLIHAPGGGTEVGGSSGSLHNQAYRKAATIFHNCSAFPFRHRL